MVCTEYQSQREIQSKMEQVEQCIKNNGNKVRQNEEGYICPFPRKDGITCQHHGRPTSFTLFHFCNLKDTAFKYQQKYSQNPTPSRIESGAERILNQMQNK